MVESAADDCRTVEQWLEEFVDGDLETAQATVVAEHLERCEECAAALRMARSIRQELRSLPQPDCSPQVLRAIKAAAEESDPWWRRWLGGTPAPLRLAGAAATLLVVIVLASVILSRTGSLPSEAPGMAVAENPLEEPVAGPVAESDPQEVERAAEEARYALAYVQRLAGRAGLAVRDEVFERNLVQPATQGLTRGLSRLRFEDEGGGAGGGAGA